MLKCPVKHTSSENSLRCTSHIHQIDDGIACKDKDFGMDQIPAVSI